MATTTNLGLGGVAASVARQTKSALSRGNKFAPPTKGLPAQRFKKLLLVCKQSRLTRWEQKGILMSPFVEKNYK